MAIHLRVANARTAKVLYLLYLWIPLAPFREIPDTKDIREEKNLVVKMQYYPENRSNYLQKKFNSKILDVEHFPWNISQVNFEIR